MNHHIIFENYDNWSNTNSLRKTHKMVYLLKNRSTLNKFFQCIPKTFIITTQNGSSKFNIDILKDTSTIISDFITNNPLVYQYYLDIEDKENVLKKFEQIYQGELVSFRRNEIQVANQIIDLLNIQNIQKPSINLLTYKDTYNIVISFKSFKKYIKKTAPHSFIISTNKKDYQCNVFGIHSSKVLSQFLEQNPLTNRFIFDFPDDCNEFQSICDIFNFKKVKITVDIMDSLKEISKILQITDILNDIDEFINEHNEILQIIDSEKELIESIEKLFDFLYHISDKSVEDVQNFIVNSKWSETEENVQEMAAFILQVIKTNSSLHPNILDLLKQLNEEANESNKLDILVPFLTDKLFSLFDEYPSICSFIYKSFKYGLITKEKIVDHLQNIRIVKDDDENDTREFFILNWFLPEIIEKVGLDENGILNLCDEKQLDFLLSYLPDDIEKYKIMRDLNEPDNKLTNAIRHDDVDLLKSMIIENNIDITKAHISYNIFEDFVQNGRTNFIDYSAAYGSIKCFKYLFLNHEIIDPITFEYSVFGSNLEMIKIAYQNMVGTDNSLYKSKVKQMFNKNYRNDGFNLIIPAIQKHQNDLFDWILEQKYTSKGMIGNFLHKLVIKSVENGNIHSLIEIIDKGYHFYNELSQNWSYNSYTYQDIIEAAAKNGFKSITLLLLSFIKRLKKFNIHYSLNFVSFGNKAIVKSAIEFMNSNDIESYFIFFIQQNDLSLLEWIIDNYRHSINLSKKFYSVVISSTIEIWKFLIKKKIPINMSYFLNNQTELASANSQVFSLILSFFSLETKTNIFNSILNSAIKIKNKDLVKYLLNQNFEFKNDRDLLFYAVETKDIEMIDIILKYNSNPDFINRISKNGTALHSAVKTRNPSIVKHLLSVPGIKINLYNANNETPLIYAAKKLCVEIIDLFIDSLLDKISQHEMNMAINSVLNAKTRYEYSLSQAKNEIILKITTLKSIDPNIIYDNTSLLLFACKNNNIEIVENLLKFDTIDPNVYLPKNGNTPLIISINNNNTRIAKLILNHPKTNLNMKNYDNNDALYFAVKNNSYEFIDLILSNENYKPKTNDISYLFYISDEKTLPHIIQSKYVDVNVTFSIENYFYSHFQNETKLFIETYANHYDSVNAIIHHPSFDQEKSNLSKALFIAYKKENFEICKLLIDVADTITIYGDRHTNLFDLAIKDQKVMIKILKSPSFNSGRVNFLDNFIKIMNSSTNDDNESVEMMSILYEYDQEHEHLINLNQLLPNGKSYFTAINNRITNNDKIFKFFVDHGIDPNIIDSDEISPFEYAISLNDEKIIDLLIDTNKIDYSKAVHDKLNFLNIFELAVNRLNSNMVAKILHNDSFDSNTVGFLNIFIRMVTTKKMPFHMITNSIYDIMNVLYEYDQEHEHLINLNQLLPNGKSYFTAISQDLSYINQIVKFFIDHGIDPNIVDSNGTSPIEYAITLNNIEFITLLIDTNKIDYSKPTTKTGFINIFDLAINKLNANTIMKILQNSNFESQSVDFLNVFTRILAKHQSESNSVYDIMNVLYEYDQEHEHLINLNQLLPNGKSYFTSISQDLSNINQVVKFFIDHGIDPNIVDSNGISPIEYAITLNNIEFITLLINTNKIEYSKPTATTGFINIFDLAINKLNANTIMKILQNSNFDSKAVEFVNVFSKMFTSIDSNHLNASSFYQIMKILYEYDLNHEHLIDLNQLLPNGKSYFTAIPHHIYNFNFSKFFIDHGIDPNIIDSEGICPFEHAILFDCKKVINLLIDTNKIDYSKTITTMKFKRKNTEKNMNLFNIILNNCEKNLIIKVIKSPSFDSKKVDLLKCFIDKYDSSSSYLKKAQIDIMNILYEYDQEHEHLINLNQLLPNGKSYFTSISHDLLNINQVVKFFIDHGIDPNIVDSNGISPIEYAITLNNVEFITLLIDTNKIDYSKSVQDSKNYINVFELAVNKLNANTITKILQNSNFDSKTVDFLNVFTRIMMPKKLLYQFDTNSTHGKMNLLYEYDQKHEHLIDLNQLPLDVLSYFTSSPHQSQMKGQQQVSSLSSNNQIKSAWGVSMKNEQKKSALYLSNQVNSSRQQKSAWGSSMKNEQQKSPYDSSNQLNSGQLQKPLWGSFMKDEQKKSTLESSNQSNSNNQQQKSPFDSSNQLNSNQQKKPLWGKFVKSEQQKLPSDSSNQANLGQHPKPLWGSFMKDEKKKSPPRSSNQSNSNKQQKPLWGSTHESVKDLDDFSDI